MLVRHLMAIAILPLTVTVLVPLSIARRYRVFVAVGEDPLQVLVQLMGIAAIAVGLLLFGASLRHFVVQGRGTLAPWDPPKNLVVDGPYQHVRNPMISGVLFIVFGEALTLRSWPHGQWALLFLFINLVYIPLAEEPQLQARFGGAYREYRRNVRRFLPRLRPWIPPGHGSTRAADP
jgi:protein-S-isoprenylcysteine O-methyltransferase Ste14